jgi:thioesterase domain-containing protein
MWRRICRLRRRRLDGASQRRAGGPQLEDLFDISKVPDRYRRLMAANLRAYWEYAPKPYPGQVTLFRARTRPLFNSHQYDLGWSKWASGGVEIKTVPGHHASILEEPAVATLAQLLKASLDRAG